MEPQDEPSIRLDDALAGRARSLRLAARDAASSLTLGVHRSRHRGVSAHFADHREYRPGDDPRRLDWRAFARTGKPVIRRYDQEARLEVRLLLDPSPSMRWRGFAPAEDTRSKYEHGAVLLGALALLLQAQGDAFAFAPLHDGKSDLKELEYLHGLRTPSARRSQVAQLFAAMSMLPPTELDIARGLEVQGADEARTGLLVVASDLLPEDGDAEWLRGLRARAREVWLLHVLHPDELDPAAALKDPARFEGLEGETSIDADLQISGPHYRKRVERFVRSWQDAAAQTSVRYQRCLSTETPVAQLATLLGRAR